MMTYDKPLPSSPDAERAVLGSILLDHGLMAQAVEVLTPDAFYVPLHRRVYRAMQNLFDTNRPIEALLIAEEMKKDGSVDSVGGIAAIAGLAVGLPFVTDLNRYLAVVRDKQKARDLIKATAKIQGEALAEETTIAEVIEDAERMIYALRSENTEGAKALNELVGESINQLRTRLETDGRTLRGVPTGFRDLDAKLSGLQKTDLIILAGRPSMGKSTLALDIAVGACKAGHVALICSLEMSKEQCTDRLICSTAGVNATGYREAMLSRDDMAKVAEAATELERLQMVIDDDSALSVSAVRAKARRVAAQYGQLDLIVVDYIQLMTGKGESRQQEVSAISRELKALAKDLKLPVVALSQLSRKCEERVDKRPLLSDLRESGGIEQDADIVAFVYRDEYYNPTDENFGVAEVLIRKHRNGATGTVKMAFMAACTKFADYYGSYGGMQ